ncbi:hypothetical protein RclHR1_25250001 [Rhizophagus clarus]|uniref:RRM domain-containing protein n=1 Tax=Rhizophagus clarus TaxID=94130 RepID=A0A2Z6QYX4_9GLOM|nr:hypothetical protein RclHR1_25250001 [Rhizophagus clarus]GES90207.1 hypothetical protein GLOIN_2v1783570 [Rhizophagus clarus]
MFKSNNYRGRNTRNSNKNSGNSNQFSFNFSGQNGPADFVKDAPPWSKGNSPPPDDSDKQREAQDSNLASERALAQDTYGSNPPPPVSSSTIGKTLSSPQPASRSHDSHANIPQNIVNNIDGTSKIPVTPNNHGDQPNKDTPHNDNSMDVDLPSNNETNDRPITHIEKDKDHVALLPMEGLFGGKAAKLTKIKNALQEYKVQYNKQLGVTKIGKSAKITFNDKEQYEKFLQLEIIIKDKKDDTADVVDIKLQAVPQKPVANKEKDASISSKEATNERTVQVIDIYAFRKIQEIREGFEHIGEIENCYTRGLGMYQTAYITFKDKAALNYFTNNWSCHVSKDIVRVLPIKMSQEDRKQRKRFSLRLSGLYYNTTGYDLQPVLDKCRDKSCFIPALIRNGKYCKSRYAYVEFATEEDMQAALDMTIEFKKGNMNPRKLFWSKEDARICNICGSPNHMANACDNKDINKSPNKKFVSGAENWKNLKKSYADAVKPGGSKKGSGVNPTSCPSKRNEKPNRTQEADPAEDFNNNPAFAQFKEYIINSIRKLQENMEKTDALMAKTDQRILDLSNTQKAIQCNLTHAQTSLTQKHKPKKTPNQDIIQPQQKRVHTSDPESSDEDVTAISPSARRLQHVQSSDKELEAICLDQEAMKQSQHENRSLLSKIYAAVAGTSTSSSFLGEDNEEMFDDANLND